MKNIKKVSFLLIAIMICCSNTIGGMEDLDALGEELAASKAQRGIPTAAIPAEAEVPQETLDELDKQLELRARQEAIPTEAEEAAKKTVAPKEVPAQTPEALPKPTTDDLLNDLDQFVADPAEAPTALSEQEAQLKELDALVQEQKAKKQAEQAAKKTVAPKEVPAQTPKALPKPTTDDLLNDLDQFVADVGVKNDPQLVAELQGSRAALTNPQLKTTDRIALLEKAKAKINVLQQTVAAKSKSTYQKAQTLIANIIAKIKGIFAKGKIAPAGAIKDNLGTGETEVQQMTVKDLQKIWSERKPIGEKEIDPAQVAAKIKSQISNLAEKAQLPQKDLASVNQQLKELQDKRAALLKQPVSAARQKNIGALDQQTLALQDKQRTIQLYDIPEAEGDLRDAIGTATQPRPPVTMIPEKVNAYKTQVNSLITNQKKSVAQLEELVKQQKARSNQLNQQENNLKKLQNVSGANQGQVNQQLASIAAEKSRLTTDLTRWQSELTQLNEQLKGNQENLASFNEKTKQRALPPLPSKPG